MNVSAIEWLTMLRGEVERANVVSIQHLSTSAIDEALYLVKPTDTLPAAAARAKDAVDAFRAAIARDITGRDVATEEARQRAIQAIDTLATRVRSSPPSDEAAILHIL